MLGKSRFHAGTAGHVFLVPMLAAGFAGGAALADGMEISVSDIGHWHVFDAKELTVSVATEDGMAAAAPVIQIARVGSDRVSSYGDDQVLAEGDGVYKVTYTPSSIGGYALVAKVPVGDEWVVSAPVAFEVARAGDEGVKATVDGTDYVYQIRYNWDPGHIHASEDHGAALVFELLRGIPTGADINWDRPWTNAFDHVSGATVMATLTTEDGAVNETLSLDYAGRGIYRGERLFLPDEVGHERFYDVRLTFNDPFNDAVVKSPDAYVMRAVAAH